MFQIVINGPGYFDTTYDLPDGITVLGRADNNDIVLSGDQVSRRHAKIEVKEGKLTIEDMGSRNGTQVNGDRVDGVRGVHPGDTINVGENTLAVREPAAAENARTDPIDIGSLQGMGLQALAISGEVLVARPVADNPFIETFDSVGHLSASELREKHAKKSGQTAEKSLEEFESLFLLIKVSEKLTSATSLNKFLEDVIDLVVEVAQAKTGVALLRSERGKLAPVVVRHSEKLSQGEVPVSDSIIAEVAKKKVAVAVADAKGDARFSGKESVIAYDLEQVLCAPMLRGDDLLGVIYLNRAGPETMPLSRLVDVVGAIAHMAANGVEKWKLREKAKGEERVRSALERHHAPAVADRIIAELPDGARVGALLEQKEATVLFADIAGFTALAERLPPERVVALLNEYYARMTRVVFSFEGTVDKFLGDAVMAVFGAPYGKADDASRAVRCALACRRDFVDMMMRRPLEERCGIKLALNTGKVLAGTLGTETRIDYSCVGETVNVASRLQQTASPGQVLITGTTLAAIGARFDVAPLGEREIRGKKHKVPVFEVLEEDSDMHTMPGV